MGGVTRRRAVPLRVPIRRGTARALGLYRAAGGLRLCRRISSRQVAELAAAWEAAAARPGATRIVVLPKTCGHPRPFLLADGPPVCCISDTGHGGWHQGSDGSVWVAPAPRGPQPSAVISINRAVTEQELAALVASIGARMDATYGPTVPQVEVHAGGAAHAYVRPDTPDTRPKPWWQWWARIRP